MNRSFQQPYNFPVKGSDDGDALLWASLLFTSGEDLTAGILACQDSEGKFWRSPARVGGEEINSFSRDMATGLILAATADRLLNGKTAPILQALQAWVDYVIYNKYQACKSSDGRGIVSPAVLWSASYAGVEVPTWARWTRGLLYPYLYFAASTNKPGFTLHLVAVAVYALQISRGNRLTHAICNKLCARQPKNPFFTYLAGKYVEATDIMYHYYVNALYNNQGTGDQWAWERADEENAWKDSCGHDFVFMSNIIKQTTK